MNRTIKFRAWDKEAKVMLDSREGSNFEIEVTARGDFLFIVGNKTGDLIPMQFTGLKDSKGKEIFEGDIIATDINKNFKKIGVSVGYVDWDKKLMQYKIVEKDNSHMITEYMKKFYEVIGDIHSDPELLK